MTAYNKCCYSELPIHWRNIEFGHILVEIGIPDIFCLLETPGFIAPDIFKNAYIGSLIMSLSKFQSWNVGFQCLAMNFILGYAVSN